MSSHSSSSSSSLSIPRLCSHLTQQLRHLLRCVDREQPLNYSECVKDVSNVVEIVEEHLTSRKIDRKLVKNGADESIYCLEISKRILLTQFELFCVSSELDKDVESAFNECKKICHLANRLMQCCSTHSTCAVEFPDFSERILKSRSKLISRTVLNRPDKHTVVHLAKFESVFIRAILGIFATYTSLLKPQGSSHKKTVYVSEEMFSLAQAQEKITWLDCLIPGAQSEGLRLAWKEMTARLWGAVADHMLESVQPVMVDGWPVVELLPMLEGLAKGGELKPYSAVVKCLWSVSASIRQQASLMQWDSGFQQLLPAMSVDCKKGLRPLSSEHKTTKATSLLLDSVLVPLTDFLRLFKVPHRDEVSTAPSFLSQHLDNLRMCQPAIAALEISFRQFSIFLTQGMTNCLLNWNLRGLGQGLFVDVPAVTEGVCVIMAASRVAAPLFAFPPFVGAHIIECSSRKSYSLLYTSHTALQPQGCGEEVCVAMNVIWSERCAQVLQAVFPTHKSWKAAGKKSGLTQLNPSSYCEVITEQLLSPVLEACLSLPARAQGLLAALCVGVLLLELRAVILKDGKTYKPSAGRQLLTDYRHLINWLITNTKSLSEEASRVNSLPILLEIEHGLLVLCGTAGSNLVSLVGGLSLCSLLPFPCLPVFREMAWLSAEDWTKAIAK